MKRKWVLWMIFFGLGLSAPALPTQIVYRGTLKGSDGVASDREYKMKFSLYGDSTKGEALWSVTIPKVRTDKNGVFQVALEDFRADCEYPPAQTNIEHKAYATLSLVLCRAAEKNPIYIGLTVADGTEIVPRLRYYPVARANRADMAFALAEGGTVRNEVCVGNAEVAGTLLATKVKTPEIHVDNPDSTLCLRADSTSLILNLDMRERGVFSRGKVTWTRDYSWNSTFGIELVTTLDVTNDASGDTPATAWQAPACIVPILCSELVSSEPIVVSALKQKGVPYLQVYRWMEGVK